VTSRPPSSNPPNGPRPKPAGTRPRHPSAGNLGDRPALVEPDQPRPSITTLSFPDGADFDTDAVRFGPGLDDESLERLIGSGDGKRVLELGCGDGSNAIALAKQGARVIVVDTSAQRLAIARANAEAHDVRVEFHHGDLADLAFVRGDQIDLCLAIYSLAAVADISRVFRQVNRVLRTEALFVISLPHPLELMCAPDASGDSVRLTRSAFDPSEISIGPNASIQAHRITDVFTLLGRSNFRVDTLLEPEVSRTSDSPFRSPLHEWIPATVILRGRKQGV